MGIKQAEWQDVAVGWTKFHNGELINFTLDQHY